MSNECPNCGTLVAVAPGIVVCPTCTAALVVRDGAVRVVPEQNLAPLARANVARQREALVDRMLNASRAADPSAA